MMVYMGILKLLSDIGKGILSIGQVFMSHKEINDESIMMWIDEIHKKECKKQGLDIPYKFKLGNPATDAAIIDKDGVLQEFVGKKGIKALGGCVVETDGSIYIEYYPSRYRDNLNDVFMCDEHDAKSLIASNVAHELYHARQFMWLYERGGYPAVDRALTEERNYNYSEGPIERGACNYSIGGIEQDFEFDLGCYV